MAPARCPGKPHLHAHGRAHGTPRGSRGGGNGAACPVAVGHAGGIRVGGAAGRHGGLEHGGGAVGTGAIGRAPHAMGPARPGAAHAAWGPRGWCGCLARERLVPCHGGHARGAVGGMGRAIALAMGGGLGRCGRRGRQLRAVDRAAQALHPCPARRSRGPGGPIRGAPAGRNNGRRHGGVLLCHAPRRAWRTAVVGRRQTLTVATGHGPAAARGEGRALRAYRPERPAGHKDRRVRGGRHRPRRTGGQLPGGRCVVRSIPGDPRPIGAPLRHGPAAHGGRPFDPRGGPLLGLGHGLGHRLQPW